MLRGMGAAEEDGVIQLKAPDPLLNGPYDETVLPTAVPSLTVGSAQERNSSLPCHSSVLH